MAKLLKVELININETKKSIPVSYKLYEYGGRLSLSNKINNFDMLLDEHLRALYYDKYDIFNESFI